MVAEFNEVIDTIEGKNFIHKVVEFFVDKSREKMKDSVFEPLKSNPAKVYYEKYKFIHDRIDAEKSDKDAYYMLADSASKYIDYIEDGLNPNLQFPFDCTHLFDLSSWFEEIDIKHLCTDEIMIMLINKLYNSPYYKLF